MAEELYINDKKIDLPERSISRTLQINDVGEVKDRQSNYSNKVSIPFTPNNVVVMEMLGVFGNRTRIQYDKLSIKYLIDGIEIITNGVGVVSNVTDNTYEIVIYDGNISISELLGNATLSDLDFSAYNHAFTESIFINSFAKTEGYIYSLADFYEKPVSSILYAEDIGVSFYVHTLFNMIFNQKGWSVSGGFLNTSDFLSRITTVNNGYDRIVNSSEDIKYSRAAFESLDVLETFGATQTTKEYTSDTYNIVDDGTFKIDLIGSISVNAGSNVSIIVRKNTSTVLSFNVGLGSFNESETFLASSGDVFTVVVKITSEPIGGGSIETIEFSTNFSTQLFLQTDSIDIDFNKLFGSVKQIDFVKDIMQRFGLSVNSNSLNKEFVFGSWSDILMDFTNVDDWSNKNPSFVSESYLSGYSQENTMKYTYDNSEDDFADGVLSVNNENISPSKNLFTSVFKASILSSDPDYYKLNQWVDNSGVINVNSDGIRMFKNKVAANTIDYSFTRSTGGFRTFTGNISYLDFVGVTYEDEIDNYYTEFKSMLDSFSKIIVSLNLSTVDIYNLDFFKLKYLNQYGAYYYLNKVISYKEGKLTKCELIRVGDIII